MRMGVAWPLSALPWPLGLANYPTNRAYDDRTHAAWDQNTQALFDTGATWDDIAWLKAHCGEMPLVVKGVLTADDAAAAVAAGADGVMVSNHGGRQLDGALSSIRMLTPILDAVGGDIEVILDSGIRSGQDVLKALAMGANGTMIGRSYIYGLGAMGQKGVTTALEIIRKELDMTMALCGETNVANLGRHNLLIPEGFEGRWQD